MFIFFNKIIKIRVKLRQFIFFFNLRTSQSPHKPISAQANLHLHTPHNSISSTHYFHRTTQSIYILSYQFIIFLPYTMYSFDKNIPLNSINGKPLFFYEQHLYYEFRKTPKGDIVTYRCRIKTCSGCLQLDLYTSSRQNRMRAAKPYALTIK